MTMEANTFMPLAFHPENNIQWAMDEGAIDHSYFFLPLCCSKLTLFDKNAGHQSSLSLEDLLRDSDEGFIS